MLRARVHINEGDTAMHSMMKSIIVGTVLVLGTGAAVATAAENPFIGTWKQNNAKSTSTSPDPWPKSVTRVITGSDQGVGMTTRTTGADGKKSTTVGPPIKWDGVSRAVTTDPAVDALSIKQLGERMVEYAYTKMGKTVHSGTGAVSNDGKTLTFTGKIMTPTGEVYYNLVHDLVQRKK